MSRKASRPAASVHGIVLLNKPSGLTSNGALQRVKRLYGARKAGHTGSLDPAATGMLPLCFGEATKVCAFLLDADKQYRVVARLGSATDTGDRDGKLTREASVPAIDRSGWSALLAGFLGPIEQVPPMYSALKKDGKRLYQLAREGQEVEREPRPVTIHDIALSESHGRRLVFRVRCSKGTYIRTLVEDIAARAGTVAYTAALHREAVGAFPASAMVSLADLESWARDDPDRLQALLQPADCALGDLDTVSVSAAESAGFLNGKRLQGQPLGAGLVRVYGPGERFLGVADRDALGALSPRRVFNLPD